MIVTRKHLHRRTFLKGMGAAVAPPLLDAMTPALSAVTRTAKAPLRMAFTYVPNGIVMSDWTPTAAGRAFEYSRILKPLEKFREDTIVLSGLAPPQRLRARRRTGRSRARRRVVLAAGTFKKLRARISRTVSRSIRSPRSNWIETRFGSLEIGCDDSRTVGNCDWGYSCAYTNSLAWRDRQRRCPGNEPAPGLRAALRRHRHEPRSRGARRLYYRRSILDPSASARPSSPPTWTADKRKLDEH
jgi:hypothetical protein